MTVGPLSRLRRRLTPLGQPRAAPSPGEESRKGRKSWKLIRFTSIQRGEHHTSGEGCHTIISQRQILGTHCMASQAGSKDGRGSEHTLDLESLEHRMDEAPGATGHEVQSMRVRFIVFVKMPRSAVATVAAGH